MNTCGANNKPRCSSILRALGLVLGLILSGAVSADTGVLFPDIREPYRGVFLEIVRGVEDRLGESVRTYPVPNDMDPYAVSAWIRANDLDAVIALGNRGVEAARIVPRGTQVIAGAVLADPEQSLNGFSGITLTPDPYVLFDRLRQLAPTVDRVVVVYSPGNEWLIARAARAAKDKNLSLNAIKANDIRQAASIYRELFNGEMRGSDAIWLPQDSVTVDETAVLGHILREAWNRNVVVFSSNPAHVRRGTLFSLYPDSFGLGRSLGALIRKPAASRHDAREEILPLSDLLTAVNIRTAEHLGLTFSAREMRQFDLVFPSQ